MAMRTLAASVSAVYHTARDRVDAAAAAVEYAADEPDSSAAFAAAEAALSAEEAELAKPYDVRVRAALAAQLHARIPSSLATDSVEQLVGRAIDLALDATLDAAVRRPLGGVEPRSPPRLLRPHTTVCGTPVAHRWLSGSRARPQEMNAAATYLLDQHRLSRRLSGAPPAVRELMLRKKEQILCAVLEMDVDGDGEIELSEFRAGLRTLGVALSDDESAQLFATMDADGGGTIQPEEVEVLLFGRPLEAARRAELIASTSRSARHDGRSVGTADAKGAAAGLHAGLRGMLRLLPLYLIGTHVPGTTGPDKSA
jgi:hypothetical protein